ncbi:hypothetical protein RF11_12820 [Thelohanellus kitauei]|uniref:Tc1-like transposase DDE domain-containing protein n=1 Tax=Thelohanellus kitauei TaxID=669202 RepID=A0A0C2M2U4_THEKT|nr:hypothetical protein RF11_12820 [Thelohanellus kitauei]
MRIVPVSRNTEETIQKRYDYSVFFNETHFKFIIRHLHMSDDTISIDETGFNLHLRRKFGRAPSGKRVSLVVTNSRGHNISVCVCSYAKRGVTSFQGKSWSIQRR